MDLQKLYNYMADNHGITLIESEMFEIIDIVKEIINDMKLKNLNKENFIELCKLRLKHENKDFIEITIEDDTFRHFNGVSFIVKSDKWADYRFSVSFDMFYPDEFMYLLGFGIEF